MPLQHTKDCSALERTMPRKFGSFSGIYSNPKSSTKGDVDRGGGARKKEGEGEGKAEGKGVVLGARAKAIALAESEIGTDDTWERFPYGRGCRIRVGDR